MNEREFKSFINQSLKGLSVDKQEEVLSKIEEKWLPEILYKFRKELSKKYTLCMKCNKHFLKSRARIESETIERIAVVARDSYGDNDDIADVTEKITYEVCPNCGNKIEKSRQRLKEENRRSRF